MSHDQLVGAGCDAVERKTPLRVARRRSLPETTQRVLHAERARNARNRARQNALLSRKTRIQRIIIRAGLVVIALLVILSATGSWRR